FFSVSFSISPTKPFFILLSSPRSLAWSRCGRPSLVPATIQGPRSCYRPARGNPAALRASKEKLEEWMSVERKTVRVDVISDCVCPWCYVGKRRLDEAVARIGDRLDVQVAWHPFQLDPSLPPEGREWTAYVRERFGSLERFAEIQQRLVEIGREVGIPFA